MNERSEPVVANVLTGFLGAGKTSLLNRLLSKPSLADTAVLINEFGAVGLDHLLVESVKDDTVLLKSGCICCTIRSDLKDAMLSLFGSDASRRAKTLQPPRYRDDGPCGSSAHPCHPDHLGHPQAAAKILSAIEVVLADANLRTRDLAGRADTRGCGMAIAQAVAA